MYIQRMNSKAFCFECGRNNIFTIAEYIIKKEKNDEYAMCRFCANHCISGAIVEKRDIRWSCTGMNENDFKNVGMEDSEGNWIQYTPKGE